MVVGITGNFGVGKTTVAKMFRQLGARIIDADEIAHQATKPHTAIYRKILAYFGRRILTGKYISRRKLAKIAFADKKKLKKLNQFMHPKILRIIKNRACKFSRKQVVVIDAALLVESGLAPWIDKLIVVRSGRNIQFKRLRRSGLTDELIEKRLRFQLSQVKKLNFADFVIDNSGTRKQTEKQVRDIWKKISEDIS